MLLYLHNVLSNTNKKFHTVLALRSTEKVFLPIISNINLYCAFILEKLLIFTDDFTAET